ncbi:MAG: AGE family epimerase/isomerase [Planctomycetes bacterium]|nr:AGE family epimerase/isomerase [Planctomycetota bacterium]
MPSRDSERIRTLLFDKLLPLWSMHGIDQRNGGFHERLDARLAPLPLGYKRLVVQCRQIYLFSHAALLTGDAPYTDIARAGLGYLREHFWDDEHGGWYFKVTPEGRPLDRSKDCYGHAFVLFALAWYYKLTEEEEALALARRTLAVLEERLAAPRHGGFLDGAAEDWEHAPQLRRQNPHMHLLEAFLALLEASGDRRYQAAAERIIGLFRRHFFDAKSATLGEYFQEDWKPHPERGHIVEPGHHFEWVWLLHQYARLAGDAKVLDAAESLHEWAYAHGIDATHRGIYDEVDRNGAVLRDTKRIWPVTECVKACAVRLAHAGVGKDGGRLTAAIDLLFDRYFFEDGRWREHLDRRLAPITTDLPGSTGYHIFQGLTEALPVL